ncbi:hypothetical protein FSB73_09435 [Arachidicoccus ginsenosidivorans]|uniref:Uncharacterized protein n=1 Tax=Arachidicoccus ginsenosidivorans TaxID=496057 RepID=A0A5B8VKY2_9BACT|nr:hypothetical protein [Arachidicoccus ginsenosidivorans]QEC71853.1 hypothetical protein FSB73_09435 [Arachidicoccus ginsenosidivorans]
MKIIDIFLVTIYLHFLKMKENGRNIVPWFQTCVSLGMVFSISFALLIKVVFEGSINKKSIPEWLFLLGFMSFAGLIFFLVKLYFFKKNRHLDLISTFLKRFSDSKRKLIKIVSVGFLIILPCIFVLIMCYQTFYKRNY